MSIGRNNSSSMARKLGLLLGTIDSRNVNRRKPVTCRSEGVTDRRDSYPGNCCRNEPCNRDNRRHPVKAFCLAPRLPVAGSPSPDLVLRGAMDGDGRRGDLFNGSLELSTNSESFCKSAQLLRTVLHARCQASPGIDAGVTPKCCVSRENSDNIP